MYPDEQMITDVLVIGAGLAGSAAAIEAAAAGASVVLASSKQIFSGSSFYPGTWGFGMIGPENEADIPELLDTICDTVGMGVADRALARTLVRGIPGAIDRLREWGVELLRPSDKGEREFIPCFDHKNRDWYGLRQKEAKLALGRQLQDFRVRQYADTQVIALQKREDAVVGAWAVCAGRLLHIRCKSCIIASGGLGGLFRYALTTADVDGMGHLLALEAGARLVNTEFFQMMMGFIQPAYKTVHNEKVFRYSNFTDAHTGLSLFADLPPEKTRQLLELRSGHGPFTSRLESKEVDFRIYRAFLEDEKGVLLRYGDELLAMRQKPEFVRTYFDWLRENKGLTEYDPVYLGLFCHASNGGIQIDADAFTGVPGLYACGEATGGMHGADRLGGLSTANGLVFGRIAGRSAADWAARCECEQANLTEREIFFQPIADAEKNLGEIKSLMFSAGMVLREEKRLQETTKIIGEMEKGAKAVKGECTDVKQAVCARRLQAAMTVSQGILQAMLLRRESRGSHARSDYPETDPGLTGRILVGLEDGRATAVFQKAQR